MLKIHDFPALQLECERIVPVDESLAATAKARLDSLAKPPGSLGRLEDLAVRLFCVQGEVPLRARPARLYTIAGDHGVVEEGVTLFPQEVTVQMVHNFLAGGAAINVLSAVSGVDLRIVDAGVAGPRFAPHPLLTDARVRPGTANFVKEPAMSLEETVRALETGVSLAEAARRERYVAVGTGEMGIGNTTASSALLCAYLGFSPQEMTGMGAGVPPAGIAHKTKVIARALALHGEAVRKGDPLVVLACLGGLEIAALAGLILGAAARRMAVIIDGFISTAAYAAAWRMAPAVEGYCFFSHASAESGHARALAGLGQRPLLDLGLRVGEGTGAVLGMFLLEAAARVFNDMATLQGAGVSGPEG